MNQNTIEKFLEGKARSANEETRYCSLLLLSAKGREDLLNSYTFEKVRQVLSERRQERWGNLS